MTFKPSVLRNVSIRGLALIYLSTSHIFLFSFYDLPGTKAFGENTITEARRLAVCGPVALVSCIQEPTHLYELGACMFSLCSCLKDTSGISSGTKLSDTHLLLQWSVTPEDLHWASFSWQFLARMM